MSHFDLAVLLQPLRAFCKLSCMCWFVKTKSAAISVNIQLKRLELHEWTIQKFQFRLYIEKCPIASLFSESSFQLLKTEKRDSGVKQRGWGGRRAPNLCSHPISDFIVPSYAQTHWAVFLKARHSGSFPEDIVFMQASARAWMLNYVFQWELSLLPVLTQLAVSI